MKNFFGTNLKVLRERKKRSQQQLADFMGIKRSIHGPNESDKIGKKVLFLEPKPRPDSRAIVN